MDTGTQIGVILVVLYVRQHINESKSHLGRQCSIDPVVNVQKNSMYRPQSVQSADETTHYWPIEADSCYLDVRPLNYWLREKVDLHNETKNWTSMLVKKLIKKTWLVAVNKIDLSSIGAILTT